MSHPTKEKRVHALTYDFNVLCGVKGANRTSIVKGPKDRLAKLVTCKTCIRMLREAARG